MKESLGRWPDRWGLAALFVVLLGFSIRVYRLDYQSFHYDEYFSVWLAGHSLSEILSRLTTNEPHPPLYYSLLHLWLGPAGSGEFAAKFLSLWFSVLVIPVAYRLGREVAGPGAGLAAALLLTVNPFQFYHAQETRMYSALELLALASSFFFVRLMHDRRRSDLLGYVLATTLALSSHYEALLLLAAQIAFVLGLAALARPARHPLTRRPWLAAWGMVGALYLPWLVAARGIALEYKSAPGVLPSWAEAAFQAWQQARQVFVAFNFHEVSVPFGEAQALAILIWAVVAALAVLLRPPGEGHRRDVCYLIVWLLLPMALALALQFRRPVFAVRYMVFLSPALAILLGLGLARLSRRSRLAAAALALALTLSYTQATYALYTDPQYARADVRGLFQYLRRVARAGDALLLDCGYQDWAAKYYFADRLPTYGFPLPPEALAEQPARLAQLSGRYRQLWLVLGGQTECDPDRLVEQALAQVAFKGAERRFTVLDLVGYAGAAEPLVAVGENVDFGGRLTLSRWSMAPRPFEPGEVVPLRLLWQAQTKLDADYAMSLRLLNSAGQMVVQRDALPLDGFKPTSSWDVAAVVPDNRGLTLPLGLPPGDYRVELRTYDRADGTALVAASAAAPPSAGITLGSVSVLPTTFPPSLDLIAPDRPLPQGRGAVMAVGYDRVGPTVLEPGQRVRFTVYWLAKESIAVNHRFRLLLVGPDGRELQRRSFAPIDGLYPAWRWRPGEVVRLDYDFVLAPTVPAGGYQLRAQHSLADGYDDLFWEQLTVRNERPLLPATMADIPVPRPVGLREGLALLGYGTSVQRAAIGDVLRLTLYWSTERELDRDYVVFVHALDAAGNIVAQQDVAPVQGAYPTSLWSAREVVRDEHLLTLPPDRVARLALGLYLPLTGERLCLLDDAGRCNGDAIALDGPFHPFQ